MKYSWIQGHLSELHSWLNNYTETDVSRREVSNDMHQDPVLLNMFMTDWGEYVAMRQICQIEGHGAENK